MAEQVFDFFFPQELCSDKKPLYIQDKRIVESQNGLG